MLDSSMAPLAARVEQDRLIGCLDDCRNAPSCFKIRPVRHVVEDDGDPQASGFGSNLSPACRASTDQSQQDEGE